MGKEPMSITTLTVLEHLRAVFATTERVERLEQELRIVADHHTSLARHMRDLLDGDACDLPNALITRTGAQQLAAMHDSNAADCTAMADIVRRALHPDQEDNA
jgi:hypothetical protein